MNWLQTLAVVFHVLFAAAIVGLVLLQRGKGADAGAGFGAGASGTVFGARGSATFFSKTTAVLAACFFVTSLALSYVATKRAEVPKSLVEQVPVQQQPAAPVAPAGLGGDEIPALPSQAPAAPASPGT